MIRVRIQASPVVKAGLESLLRTYAQFELIEEPQGEPDPDSLDGGPADEHDSHTDVILADDDAAQTTAALMDGAGDAAPTVLLVRDPATAWNVALRRGVRAVLPSNATAAQIAAAIEAAAAGLVVFDAEDIEQLLPPRPLDHSSEAIIEPLVEPITPRELEVLRSVAEGLANKEIAARLGISENTVKFHVASVMGKLGAASRTEAVTLGIRRGLILL